MSSGYLNKVSLIGNLGRDPEVRSFSNGGKVCNLRLATSETWRDKVTGEKRERTQWHAIAIFNEGLIGIAEKYLKKGSKCYIEGQLETRKWQDQSGQDRYSTEVVLRPYNGDILLLPSADGRRGDRHENSGGSSDGSSGGHGGGNSGASGPGPSDMDDEIPF